MSYSNDFNELYSRNGKIPYDDTPISRPSEKKSAFSGKASKRTSWPKNVKILAGLVAVLVCLNIVMSFCLYFSLKDSSDKYITVMENNISVNGSAISSYAVQTAWYSSVCISAGGQITDYSSFYSKAMSRGSGVILSKTDGYVYIVTCYHVIKSYENEVYVLFSSYLKPIKATTVGYSSSCDVAVLKVKDSDYYSACLPVEVFNSQYVSLGDTVFAVGNALAGGLSVTSGLLSRVNKLVNIDGVQFRELQTSAPINSGNSGGGLFNAEGKFIGLINAKLSSTTSSSSSTATIEGIAYAMPGTYILSVANSIIYNSGTAKYVYIGATFAHGTLVSSTIVEEKTVEDYQVVVSGIAYGSAAYGKLSKEDEIEYFIYTDLSGKENYVTMFNMYCFDDICYNILPNSTIYFKVFGSDTLVSVLASKTYTQT